MKKQKSRWKTKEQAYEVGRLEGSKDRSAYWEPRYAELKSKLEKLEQSQLIKQLEIREHTARSLAQVADAIARVVVPQTF